MQLRKSQLLAGLVLASSMVLAPVAVNAANHAQNNHATFNKANFKHGSNFKHNFRNKNMSKLDLSQEQKDKLFEMRQAREAEMYEQRKAINAANVELRDLAKAEKFDADKAKKAATDLGQAKGQMALIKAQSRADFMALLTPEQKQKLAERKEKRKSK